jgi:hypothetical protein
VVCIVLPLDCWANFFNFFTLECYTDIVHKFLGHLNEKEIAKEWFQQDYATCHTAQISMHNPLLLFGDWIILKGLWPPRPTDL